MAIFSNSVCIKNFSGSIVVNGNNVSLDNIGDAKKYDERKEIGVDGEDTLVIKSDGVSVEIKTGQYDVVEAHLCGEGIIEKEPVLTLSKKYNKIDVLLDIGNSYTLKDLKLYIYIPKQSSLYNIIFDGYNSNFGVSKDVMVDFVNVHTHNGNIDSNCACSALKLRTHNGNVNVHLTATEDIDIKAVSHNGNVNVFLRNVKENNITMVTKNGNKYNNFHGQTGYIAKGEAITYNGNVTIG